VLFSSFFLIVWVTAVGRRSKRKLSFFAGVVEANALV